MDRHPNLTNIYVVSTDFSADFTIMCCVDHAYRICQLYDFSGHGHFIGKFSSVGQNFFFPKKNGIRSFQHNKKFFSDRFWYFVIFPYDQKIDLFCTSHSQTKYNQVVRNETKIYSRNPWHIKDFENILRKSGRHKILNFLPIWWKITYKNTPKKPHIVI